MYFNRYLNKLDEHYSFIKKFAKPRNKLCGVVLDDITDLPYDVLKKEVPNLFENQQFEKAIHLVLKHYKKNITFMHVNLAKNRHKLLFVFWIREQYKKINELESSYLVTIPDPKLLQAGIKDLDVLGDVNTVDSLAGGDILKWEKIRKLPYSEVFNKLLKNTIEARINKKLVELNKKKFSPNHILNTKCIAECVTKRSHFLQGH